MKNPSKRTWIALVIIGVFLMWLIQSIDIDTILGLLSSIKWDSFFVASLFILAGLQIIPLRWYTLQENRHGFLHTYQTNAITYMMRMFMPIPISLLRIATITLTEPISLAQIAPAVVAERIVETFMRFMVLIVVASALRGQPAWSLLWIIILMVLFAGFVRIASRSEEYIPRLKNWFNGRTWGKSQRVQGALSGINAGVVAVSTPRRLIFSLLFSLLMGTLFLAGHIKLFEAVGLKNDLPILIALAAGVVFLLPPSTSQMILVYLSLLVATLAPLQIIDVNTALVYGLLAFGIQLIFWMITGIWGLAYIHLSFREILKTINTIRNELAQGNEEAGQINDRNLDSGGFNQS